MIKIFLEVHEGTSPFKVTVQAASINQAVISMKERYPGHEVRVVFPIDSEEFFTKIGADESRQPLHATLLEAR